MKRAVVLNHPNHAFIVLDKNLLERICGMAVGATAVSSRGCNVNKRLRRTFRHHTVHGNLLAACAHLVVSILACKSLRINREEP